jgi:Plant mobile domain
LTAKGHRLHIPYNTKCDRYLKNIGLFHVARIGHTNIDKAYITTLVERWRPETHTFHMPVGELTVTLQDVACLWGLPIDGIPITGVSDRDWTNLVIQAFGKPLIGSTWLNKKRTVAGQTVYKQSRYSLSLSWLTEQFPSLRDDATSEEVVYYTRAFIMDLFGTLLFPDSTWSGVPAMYLQFLMDLEHPQQYNWGAAVLALLYRNLSIAARAVSKSITGPVILLQMWGWTWFNVSRPKPLEPFTAWGEPDLDSCQPYGRYWTGKHTFIHSPNHAGPGAPRDMFDSIMDTHINWCPYNFVMTRLPSVVCRDIDIWMAKVALIHFWVVSYYYPDRVMRQFGLSQTIPPPDPLSWGTHLQLDNVEHTSRIAGTDWRIQWQSYVDEWIDVRNRLVPITGVYDFDSKLQYMQWYEIHGMRTVFLERYFGGDLSQPRLAPGEPIHTVAYVPRGDIPIRQVTYILFHTLFYLQLFFTCNRFSYL